MRSDGAYRVRADSMTAAAQPALTALDFMTQQYAVTSSSRPETIPGVGLTPGLTMINPGSMLCDPYEHSCGLVGGGAVASGAEAMHTISALSRNGHGHL